jgi:hypothetical protein
MGVTLRRTGSRAIWVLIAIAVIPSPSLLAATSDRITQTVDPANVFVLPNHHPQWANPGNSAGVVRLDHFLNPMTLVLARSPQQEIDFEKFLADQQNPLSPDYHHWLTPTEVGDRYGLSDHDIATLTDWLQSQGLLVNWISPSRLFIGFGGTAGNLGRAFRTDFRYYNVHGAQRMSVSSDPIIPQALSPAIKAIRGLYTIQDKPLHHARPMLSDSPLMNSNSGAHFLAPADFAAIYDVPLDQTSQDQTIGIVGRSRTDFADFSNFRSLIGSGFLNPTEIVPTAYGGVDPGPAYTSPPAANVSIEDQLEATLDVLRAGSVAPSSKVLLVVASDASGGIDADAHYLVETTPVPVQVMSISFGACELEGGQSGVDFWDTLFQQAAAEGISSFVSSGDAGASGCDANFGTPPANPLPNSPNYICSSSYVTCVGGTEFNEAGNASTYWNPSNGAGLNSAHGYIPEGGWNEPLDSNSAPQAASSAGGVSAFIPTPAWQKVPGVPAARSGRYTPDISFSASGHDGYFGCFAAGGYGCVVGTNGSYGFEYFFGTSAAAPAMAGIAAMLNQRNAAAQGNLNPGLYATALFYPAAVHDITVATSGVTACIVDTPSRCNNSIHSATGLTGGQAGYLETNRYDLVTGLGSLDVQTFLNDYFAFSSSVTPTITVSGSWSVTTTQILTELCVVSADKTGFPASTGTITVSSGSYSSTPIPLATGTAYVVVPGASLSIGNDTLTFVYTPDSPGSFVYNAASTTASVTVTQGVQVTPAVQIAASPNITTAQSLSTTIGVSAGSNYQVPSGSVILSGGGYTSAATPLTGGSAGITIPAGSLALGTNTLTASYTPDAAGSTVFTSASGSATVTVTIPASFGLAGTSVSVAPGATSGNSSTITVTPSGGFTGSVALTAAITASPGGAQYTPTLSFGSTTPASISGAKPGTATLTISTTAPTSASLAVPRRPGAAWYATGAGTLACVLILGFSKRRRSWQSRLGITLLLATFAFSVLACGGGGSGGGGGGGTPGTTAGTYTVTVTGISGAVTQTGTVTLTVQ